MAGDGIRYLNPEVTMLFKALQHRPKDEVDLDNVWPLLDDVQRAWLVDAVRRTLPDHPWQSRLDPADGLRGATGSRHAVRLWMQ